MTPLPCEGKETFGTLGMAKRVSDRRNAVGNRRGNAYRCQHCGKAHIGSITPRRRRERMEIRMRREEEIA